MGIEQRRAVLEDNADLIPAKASHAQGTWAMGLAQGAKAKKQGFV